MRALKLSLLTFTFASLLTFASAKEASISGADINLTISPATPSIAAGDSTSTFLKVAIQGTSEAVAKERVPVNVAIVLDRSSSMSGEKLLHAKKAAAMFVQNLDKNDIVSIIAYDSVVEVIVPATKLTDKALVVNRINNLQSNGSTALFGGVSHGAAEVRKFISDQQVNRVLLLSDGQANVGPSSIEELGQLGVSLAKENITVSTVGLGLNYNEDLMNLLAAKGDGRATFAEEPQHLAGFFQKELRAITNTIASEVEITVSFPDSIKPVRVMADRGTIDGQTVTMTLSSLYQDWENFFLIEAELPKTEAGTLLPIATGEATWRDLADGKIKQAHASAAVKITEAETVQDEKVLTEVVKFKILETGQKAIALRDAGEVEQARVLLQSNGSFIADNEGLLQSDKNFDRYEYQNRNVLTNIDTEFYGQVRKENTTFSQGDVWQIKD